MNFNALINGWAVKLIAIASVINYIFIAYMQGSMPEVQPYILGLIVMITVASFLQYKVKMPDGLKAVGLGIICYAIYSLVMTFTTINTDNFVLTIEALKAMSFGVFTFAVYYVMRLFGK
jgi:hypothetical protein